MIMLFTLDDMPFHVNNRLEEPYTGVTPSLYNDDERVELIRKKYIIRFP